MLGKLVSLSDDCKKKSVEETSTDPRDPLSKYFAFHIFSSNSPAIRTALTNSSTPNHVLCMRPKRSFYRKYILYKLFRT